MIRALQEHITATFLTVCAISTLAYLFPSVPIFGVLQLPMWAAFLFIVHVRVEPTRPSRARQSP